MSSDMRLQRTVSVVVPIFNEEQVLSLFHARLRAVLETLPYASEIIYVDDGSRDRTLEVLRSIRGADETVGIIELSRNFGKEAALTAGLDVACGDAVVVIDADLQDPPELIPVLIDKWEQGFDVVYATRRTREGESFLKKATAHCFYRLMGKVSDIDIPADTGDFRLMSQRAVAAIGQLREQNRFMKGLYAWIGFRQTSILYDRDARASGKTKFNYRRLLKFAIDGITGFSTIPLRIATSVGLLVAVPAFGMAFYTVGKTLLFGDPVRGYPSLMTVVLMLGGLQLFFLGILGEYVGRLFNESKRRPLYLVAGYTPARETDEEAIQFRRVSDPTGSRGIAAGALRRADPVAHSPASDARSPPFV